MLNHLFASICYTPINRLTNCHASSFIWLNFFFWEFKAPNAFANNIDFVSPAIIGWQALVKIHRTIPRKVLAVKNDKHKSNDVSIFCSLLMFMWQIGIHADKAMIFDIVLTPAYDLVRECMCASMSSLVTHRWKLFNFNGVSIYRWRCVLCSRSAVVRYPNKHSHRLATRGVTLNFQKPINVNTNRITKWKKNYDNKYIYCICWA